MIRSFRCEERSATESSLIPYLSHRADINYTNIYESHEHTTKSSKRREKPERKKKKTRTKNISYRIHWLRDVCFNTRLECRNSLSQQLNNKFTFSLIIRLSSPPRLSFSLPFAPSPRCWPPSRPLMMQKGDLLCRTAFFYRSALAAETKANDVK